ECGKFISQVVIDKLIFGDQQLFVKCIIGQESLFKVCYLALRRLTQEVLPDCSLIVILCFQLYLSLSRRRPPLILMTVYAILFHLTACSRHSLTQCWSDSRMRKALILKALTAMPRCSAKCFL